MITKTTVTLLIIENMDRHEGYRFAAERTLDSDLRYLFSRLSNQSKDFAEELRKFQVKEEENRNCNDSVCGKTSGIWTLIKESTKDRKSILALCESGEDTVVKCYDEVLNQPAGLSSKCLDLLTTQKSALQASHEEIKAMLDNYIIKKQKP